MGKALTAVLSLLIVSSFTLSPAQSKAESIGADSSSNIVYQEWNDSKRGRELPIKIYLPKSGAAPYPVVIFSHGLGGSREAAQYLGDYWSQHGYLGVFVQHPGSDSSVWQSAVTQGRQAILQRMRSAANGKNLLDRAQDMKFVLDELERRNRNDPALKGKLDLAKIAMAGHSFGAGTTLALAGQNFAGAGRDLEIKDERVKAAIYLCPPVVGGKSSANAVYGGIQIPGLLLTGTEDNSPINDIKAEDRRIPYDGIKSSHQYLVNFVGADHEAFGGRSFRAAKEGDDKIHWMVDMVSTRFLDASLKGNPAAWQWLDSEQIKTYLGNAAMFERK